MNATFALIRERCGLSLAEAADFLDVSADSIRSWSSGRRSAPQGAIDEMRALYRAIEDAAAKNLIVIGDLLADNEPPGRIELGLAKSNAEAKRLGLPCIGAHAAMLGLVAARLALPVSVVPRESTMASATAAKAHRIG